MRYACVLQGDELEEKDGSEGGGAGALLLEGSPTLHAGNVDGDFIVQVSKGGGRAVVHTAFVNTRMPVLRRF
jgi:hypothetical protein